MEFSRRNLIRIALLASTVAVLSACPGKAQKSFEGHGVGAYGGGDTIVSSPELVNRMIDFALVLAAEPDPNKNIFVKFWIETYYTTKGAEVSIPTHVFPNIVTRTSQFGLAPNADFSSPPLRALTKNDMTRLPEGDCPHSPDETTADASVSSHNLTGKVCYSVGNLSKISPSDLLRQILALSIHEASHLGGAGEDEAHNWQIAFSNYFGAHFGDPSRQLFGFNSTMQHRLIAEEIALALDDANGNPSVPTIFGKMGQIEADLRALPNSDDPTFIQIKLLVLKSDLASDYTSRIVKLRAKISSIFIDPPADSFASPGNGVLVSAPQNFVQVIASIQSDFEDIRTSFNTLIKASPDEYDCPMYEWTRNTVGNYTTNLYEDTNYCFPSEN